MLVGLCQVIVGNLSFQFFPMTFHLFFVHQINPAGFIFLIFNKTLS